MSVPGFGFQISDVILLTKVTNKVIHALKKEGATSEYQKACGDLESLQAVLETLKVFFDDPSLSPSLRNAVQAQLSVASTSIALFNKKLQSKYGASLASLATPAPHRKAFKSVDWTFRAAKDLAEFRTELFHRLEPTRFLCSMQNAHSSARAASAALEIKSLVSANTTLIAVIANRNRDTIQNQIHGITEVQAEASEQQKKASGSLQRISNDMNSILGNQLRVLRLAEEASSRGQAQFEATENSFKQIHTTITSRLDHEKLQVAPTALETTQYHIHNTELEAVIAFWIYQLLSALRAFFTQVFGLTPHIFFLLRSSRIFAIVPRLVIRQDSIVFEDYLGHKRRLDYMWAQYFDVFKAFLINDYKRKPGAAEISKDAYHILRMFRHQSLVLTKENWREAVVPSSNIVVSILITSMATDYSPPCPLCKRTLEKTSISMSRFCQFCNQYYYLDAGYEDATASGSASTDTNENIAEMDHERAEMRQFKHMHLPVSKVVDFKSICNEVVRGTKWYCCNCGHGPRSVPIAPLCSNCGHSRCRTCPVE